jgi:hypothetical protein
MRVSFHPKAKRICRVGPPCLNPNASVIPPQSEEDLPCRSPLPILIERVHNHTPTVNSPRELEVLVKLTRVVRRILCDSNVAPINHYTYLEMFCVTTQLQLIIVEESTLHLSHNLLTYLRRNHHTVHTYAVFCRLTRRAGLSLPVVYLYLI